MRTEVFEEDDFLDKLFRKSLELLFEHESCTNQSDCTEKKDETCRRIDDWFNERLEKACTKPENADSKGKFSKYCIDELKKRWNCSIKNTLR